MEDLNAKRLEARIQSNHMVPNCREIQRKILKATDENQEECKLDLESHLHACLHYVEVESVWLHAA